MASPRAWQVHEGELAMASPRAWRVCERESAVESPERVEYARENPRWRVPSVLREGESVVVSPGACGVREGESPSVSSTRGRVCGGESSSM